MPLVDILFKPTPYLNLALYNNQVPPIQELKLVNVSEEPISGISVLIEASPRVFEPFGWEISTLGVGQRINLATEKLELNRELLHQRNEAEPGRITIICKQGETVLQTATETVRLLPTNHWGGYLAVPELLAAHVLPNDPIVAGVLHQASELLAALKSPIPLNGYQAKNPREVSIQFAAAMTAIAKLSIHYSNPPASFETHGQKVRTPSDVNLQKLGTCLDLTTFGASVLEQAGLHPVIVLVKSHCYLGCWLHDSPLTTGVIQDAQFLRKAVRNGSLVVVETTMLTGAAINVNEAIFEGQRLLNASENFEVAIDIFAARRGERISPLSTATPVSNVANKAGFATDVYEAIDLESLSSLDHVLEESFSEENSKSPKEVKTGSARVEQWKSQLLNLTRRNRLLNWRPTGGALHLQFIDGAHLEDQLADGVSFAFGAVDGERGEQAAITRKLPADHYADAIRSDVARGRISLLLKENALSSSLIKLERSTRTALEEGGANTLFIAIGFAVKPQAGSVASFDPKASGKDRAEYTAPLILIPVELKRKRAGSSFSLVARDEEAILNPTLQELLKREVGVDFGEYSRELPFDDSGIDVDGILRRVRQELLNVPGWEVLDEVALGEFSFAKYLMWRDLDAFEPQLKQNAVVRHLIDTPRQPYFNPSDPKASTIPDASTLDQTFPVGEMLTPMSADSSQLAAVRAAAQGIDFVLEGPPGTGKSQTITNLIAQCLGEGKTVLFVSEKTAALEVVERRLNRIGLGEFCLELHSNRATKSAVYDQLRQAREKSETLPSSYLDQAVRLGNLRGLLNSQVEALHTHGVHGLTVYELVAYAASRQFLDAPEPETSFAKSLDGDRLQQARDVVREMAIQLSDVSAHSRESVKHISASFDSAAFAKTCQEAVSLGAEVSSASAKLGLTLGLSKTVFEGNELVHLDRLAKLVLEAKGKDLKEAAGLLDSGKARRRVAEEKESVFEIVKKFETLSTAYNPEVAQFDAVTNSNQWKSADQSWIIGKWWAQRKLKHKLNAFARKPSVSPETDLALLSDIQRETGNLSSSAKKDLVLQKDYLNELLNKTLWLEKFSEWTADPNTPAIGLSQSKLSQILDDLAEERSAANNLLQQCSDLNELMVKSKRLSIQLSEMATKSETGVFGEGGQPAYSKQLVDTAQRLLDNKRDWRPQQLFAAKRNLAESLGLGYFSKANYSRSALDVSPAAAVERFELGVRRVLAKAALAEDPLLSDFSGTAFEDLIAQFEKLDEEFSKVTINELRLRLHKRQGNIYRQELRGAVGLLQQELQKKRRQMPVRQLVLKLGKLLTELTPCLLMSPLSVAQYLPADAADIRFDVVVFDEASQIPVWDAIGAIARGSQVVVVGDSKQLPPTNFFGKSETDEVDYSGEELVVEDMESILDEMKAAQMQTWGLRWHYRSRAESLIAFSNRQYYDGRLHTFPAPVSKDTAVSWHKVESREYLKGKNRKEGQQLVDYLVDRLRRTPPSEQTFGVVTFGQAQQSLIEDLLEDARQSYPEIEAHFDTNLDERLFVKNIENVQGDERAVILFSITYGPDLAGKVAMRFGPMNQTGGERRLNVAVTRAREEMHLFSSMEPTQIDLKRLGVAAQGARDLRYFLEFAKLGPSAFAKQITSIGGDADYDSPFEQAVAKKLRARGYETDIQVGVSGYRIDLGVRDPKRPGHYLAGVECDGASYHSTATARERDLLRQSVLEGLGWNIIRVWSLDWWHDADRVADKLADELSALKNGTKAKDLRKNSQVAVDKSESERSVSIPPALPSNLNQNSSPSMYMLTTSTHLESLKMRAFKLTRNQFEDPLYEAKAAPATQEMIQVILEREAPILLIDLIGRVAKQGYGYANTGSKIKRVVCALVEKVAYVTREHGDEVVWLNAEQASGALKFRPPNPVDLDVRGIPQIPIIELQALARTLMPEGLLEDDLIREMGSQIGLGSVRGSSRTRVKKAVDLVWAEGDQG